MELRATKAIIHKIRSYLQWRQQRNMAKRVMNTTAKFINSYRPGTSWYERFTCCRNERVEVVRSDKILERYRSEPTWKSELLNFRSLQQMKKGENQLFSVCFRTAFVHVNHELPIPDGALINRLASSLIAVRSTSKPKWYWRFKEFEQSINGARHLIPKQTCTTQTWSWKYFDSSRFFHWFFFYFPHLMKTEIKLQWKIGLARILHLKVKSK